jgi:uncharacterized phosphosugar-binding protein
MMSEMYSNTGLGRYWQAIQQLQEKVWREQAETLAQVAGVMAEAVRRDQRLLVFGTGHSHLLAEEGHFRAGGLAAVVPILEPSLMLHENASLAAVREREPGVAEPLLKRYSPQAGEVLVVFSNSGINGVPVEMAQAGKAHGLRVVAVCALKYARHVTHSGPRLFEVADYVIDNGGEPGDSLIAVEGLPWAVGPSSTVLGALIWNALITEVACQLQAADDLVPVYASANMPGSVEHNAALLKHWRARNPHL